MTLDFLRQYVQKKVLEHQHIQAEIMELWQLCLDNIEEGESQQNEINLCYSDIEDLIESRNSE